MGGNSSLTSLEALVGEVLEAESGGVETGSLLGVSDPEEDVVKAEELSEIRLKWDK